MDQITGNFAGYRVCKPADADGTCWGVYRIQTRDGQVIAVGSLPSDALRTALRLTLIGEWRTSKWGKQFVFNSYAICRPAGRDGTIAFLRQATGVGQVTAEALWEMHGHESIEVAICDGKALRKASKERLSEEQAEIAASFLKQRLVHQEGRLALAEMFAGLAFPRNLPDKVLEFGVADPIREITDNPYWLMRFPGASFSRCDKLRERLGLPARLPARQRAAVMHLLQARGSDIWLSRDVVAADAADLLTVDIPEANEQINVLLLDGDLAQREGYIALAHAARTERRIVQLLEQRADTCEKATWPTMSEMDGLTQHQLEQLNWAFRSKGRVAFLLGQAGSGKTWSAAAVIRRFSQVLAVAPTGKAAQRLRQVLSALGIHWVHPMTAHKALKAQQQNGGTWQFLVDGENEKLDTELLVIDEASMLDNDLAYALLKGVSKRTHILVVGDPFQLPPVGRGALLRDWLEISQRGLGYTCGLLEEIHRHEGQIVQVADQIRRGQAVQMTPATDLAAWTQDTNAQLLTVGTDTVASLRVRILVSKIMGGDLKLLDGRPATISDLQVIVANNEGSDVSREALNYEIQKIVTGRPDPAVHEVYNVGDRVMCTKNALYPTIDKRAIYVANGEQGVVAEFDGKHPVIRIESGDELEFVVLRTPEHERQFTLAYAITAHKAQGSGWPVVAVIPGMGNRAQMVTDRSWLYTAVTRAEQLCIVLCNESEIKRICSQTKVWNRRTFFVECMEEHYCGNHQS